MDLSMSLNCSLFTLFNSHIMSMIKAWLHDQMEQEIREEEMFFNADKHYEIEQAMREGMDEPSTQQEELNESTD